MSEEEKNQGKSCSSGTEGSEQVKELQNQLEQKLAGLLAHPLVPQEFKEVFKEENQCQLKQQ